MDSGWWGIYTLAFYPKIFFVGQIDLLWSSVAIYSEWWPPLFAFLSLSYDLSLTIDIYL
jgi:hypothetical protein